MSMILEALRKVERESRVRRRARRGVQWYLLDEKTVVAQCRHSSHPLLFIMAGILAVSGMAFFFGALDFIGLRARVFDTGRHFVTAIDKRVRGERVVPDFLPMEEEADPTLQRTPESRFSMAEPNGRGLEGEGGREVSGPAYHGGVAELGEQPRDGEEEYAGRAVVPAHHVAAQPPMSEQMKYWEGTEPPVPQRVQAAPSPFSSETAVE